MVFLFAFIISLPLIFILVWALVKLSKKVNNEKFSPYKQKEFFFTRSEQQFFNILNSKLEAHKHTVFPKVRLGDMVHVEDLNNNYGDWARIRSKHVDFLIWDLVNQNIALAIELDGKSHNSQKAQKADGFKDKLFEDVGIKLKRIKVGMNFDEEMERIVGELENGPEEAENED